MKGLISFLALFGLMEAAALAANEWAVYPSGDEDGVTDAANIQAAIDAAEPGDTIILKAGTFYLGAGDGDVVVPLPEDDWMSFLDYQPEASGSQFLIVDKPLVITGEQAVDGDPATKLEAVRKCQDVPSDNDPELGYAFIVGAPDVEFKELEFYGSFTTIYGFWAGTNIHDCMFRDICSGPVFAADERSIYPHYPQNFEDAKKSWLRDNKFLGAAQGIHLVSSEVTVEGNTFNLANGWWTADVGIFVTGYAYKTLPEELGGMGLSLVRSVAQNNVIKNNSFRNSHGLPAVYLSSDWGGAVRDNVVAENEMTDCSLCVLVSESNYYAVGGTTIERNAFKENRVEPSDSGIAFWGGRNNTVKDNVIVGPGWGRGIWIEWNGSFADGATPAPGDPPVFMVPAIGNIVKGNHVTGADYGVYLGAFARDSVVKGNSVFGSAVTDYFLSGPEYLTNLGFGPASGNELKIDGTATYIDESGCTNVDVCSPFDDDRDGRFDEDWPDYTNNDGDFLFGYYSLTDEDPPEKPNKLTIK